MSNTIQSNSFHFSSETISLIKYHIGSTFVIKYGGSVMKNDIMQYNIIQDISLLHVLGIKVILVHGGGYMIDRWLKKLNINSRFENGIRITDSETVEVVEMVLSGKINKKLVSLFNTIDVKALGLSGKDSNLVTALPISSKVGSFTGKVHHVNTNVLNILLSSGFLPVISSVASDTFGQTYNINADTLASSIAASLQADKYIMITDTPGILIDVNNPDTLVKKLNSCKAKKLKSDGLISGGMIPKLDSCLYSLNNNVKSAHIIDGKIRYSLLRELFTKDRVGSIIVL
uniref:Acetylglutamate kinase n=1 Tax=Tolypiocladia glomerulata TaxID=860646 RepID=A0A1Z1MV13_9FLOR|nr:acetylglutamate kinase [Tolypiocladia glomerulata]ARW69816.1 acetylglutamate kinase [Tolypiocladia glomerulata]